MLAAAAKKAERASKDTRLITNLPPELEGWLGTTEDRQAENYK